MICLFVNTATTESFSDKKIKICVLKGSPKKNGYTEHMLNTFLENFPCASTDIFDAYAVKAKPCTDCKFCCQTFGCSSNDLDDFFKSYESCDIFVAAFPIYFLSIPAPMKSVLDRFQKYFSARFSLNIKRPVKKERIGVLISSCGSNDETGFSIALKQWKMAFSVSGIKLVENICLSDTDSDEVSEEKYLQQIDRSIREINNFLKGRSSYVNGTCNT